MKTENKPYPHFCANCQLQIGENDREFWFDAFDPNPKPKTFCSVECIADYYDISIEEVQDIFLSACEDKEDSE